MEQLNAYRVGWSHKDDSGKMNHSKAHLIDAKDHHLTLCGVEIPNDADPSKGLSVCKRCDKKAEKGLSFVKPKDLAPAKESQPEGEKPHYAALRKLLEDESLADKGYKELAEMVREQVPGSTMTHKNVASIVLSRRNKWNIIERVGSHRKGSGDLPHYVELRKLLEDENLAGLGYKELAEMVKEKVPGCSLNHKTIASIVMNHKDEWNIVPRQRLGKAHHPAWSPVDRQLFRLSDVQAEQLELPIGEGHEYLLELTQPSKPARVLNLHDGQLVKEISFKRAFEL